ncbi:hypothetical protein CK203_059535 [Vitis vinifera]|uniref:Uncharacterized protein n=1 Tax=Vitis vinifera TaxID=29760 RepID=A0A438FRN7_VITVI|nr:hypothetical protein CK203_059535 [Vitis vinifera]
MSSKKKTVSSTRVGDAHEKATDKLDVKEFQDRFCIPNGVIVELLNDEEVFVPTEKAEKDTIIFSKEQSTRGSGSLCRRCSRNSSISPRFHPPSFIPTSSGMSAHLPSLQLVTELPDSTKGGAKGHVVVRGAWAGSKHPARPLSPNYSLVIPGPEKRGHIVDWVEKTSFACLNKLFEIDAKERHYKTLLSMRNLMAVVRKSQDYVVNILSRKLPRR